MMLLLVGVAVGWFLRRPHLCEDGVQAFVTLLGLLAVSLDPLGHQVEHLGLEMARTALGVPALGHQPGVGQHPDVLGHRLHRDVVGRCQVADRRVPCGEAGDDVAPRRIRKGREHPGQLVVDHARLLAQLTG
jgi:hypothetical protein